MKPERPRRCRQIPCLLAITLAILLAVPALSAEFPPKKLENLQVLPKGMAVPELIAVMRAFSMGLGVRCQHCHSGDPAAPMTETDFKADDKEAKRKARVMLRMTQAINDTHLPKLGGEASSRITVQCVTCHRGQLRPAMLGDVLSAELDSEGIDAAVAKYRQLREEFYGSHSFDFSEWTLLTLAESLLRSGRPEACEAMLRLNLEFFQESTSSWNFLAEFYRRQDRIDDARAAIAKTLALDPEDRRAQKILAAIEKAGQSGEESQN